MDNKHMLEVEQTDKAKAKVEEKGRWEAKIVMNSLTTIESRYTMQFEDGERRVVTSGSTYREPTYIQQLEGKITAENAKLAAEKKAEKTGIEGGAMSKAKDEGKDKPEGQKYTYVSQKPLKKTASRDKCASNQLAEAKVEREDKLKAGEKQT